MRRTALSILCLGLCLTGLANSALAAKRVALVIGNDTYEQVPALLKAVNDARALGDALEELGFRVLRAENIRRRDMNLKLLEFSSQLDPGDVALFFFAGHGVEIDGRNYLLPTDIPSAQPGQEDFVKGEGIAVDRVLDTIRGRGARISMLVLDACRNNPFAREGTRSLGGTRGLAGMAAPEGSFIMYSAGVGQTALDRLSDADPNPNSVFTRSLIPLLKEQGLSLVPMARRLRRDVQELARTISHEQRPAYYDEVTGDFFFAGKPAGGPEPSSQPQVSSLQPAQVPRPAATDKARLEVGFWNYIKDKTNSDYFQKYIEQYPDGAFVTIATQNLKKLEAERQDFMTGKRLEERFSPPRIVLLEKSAQLWDRPSADAKEAGIAKGGSELILLGTVANRQWLKVARGPIGASATDSNVGFLPASILDQAPEAERAIRLQHDSQQKRALQDIERSVAAFEDEEGAKRLHLSALRYGAVAKKGNDFFGVWDRGTEEEAKQAALDSCGGSSCTLEATLEFKWCYALFRSKGNGWGWATGNGIDNAIASGRQSCTKRNKGCWKAFTFCADGSNVYSK